MRHCKVTDRDTDIGPGLAEFIQGVAPGRPTPIRMSLGELQGRQPLPTVLSALKPPRQTLALLKLHLSACQLPPAGMHGCSSLAALTQLSLVHCTSPPGGFDAALAALLQQVPQLQTLEVVACARQMAMEPFPESLRTLSGPTSLVLDNDDLSGLPEGPCWAGKPVHAGWLPAAKRLMAARPAACLQRLADHLSTTHICRVETAVHQWHPLCTPASGTNQRQPADQVEHSPRPGI